MARRSTAVAPADPFSPNACSHQGPVHTWHIQLQLKLISKHLLILSTSSLMYNQHRTWSDDKIQPILTDYMVPSWHPTRKLNVDSLVGLSKGSSVHRPQVLVLHHRCGHAFFMRESKLAFGRHWTPQVPRCILDWTLLDFECVTHFCKTIPE